MGRCIVYSITDCPFCLKAKSMLRSHNVEYDEINLSHYPSMRKVMIEKTHSLTVPQIFFVSSKGVNHVGGASELAAIEDKIDTLWEETKNGGDYEDMSPFTKPDYPPAPEPVASDRKIETFGSKSAVEIVPWIEKNLGLYFHGSKLVSLLASSESIGRDKATKIGNELLEAGLIVVSKKNVEFSDSSAYFGLVKAKKRVALNNFRIWKDRVDPDPLITVTILKKRLGKVLSKYRDDEGMVDYAAASTDADFYAFDEAICEVQQIDLVKMEPDERLAFGINLYNVLTKHALVKVGIPSSNLERGDFFGQWGYEIGGHFYSFNALENGVLRTNKTPPYSFSKTIPSSDPRLKAVMPKLDHRIHFALNCGAKSCPPVKTFTKEAINEELLIASQAFFQQEENFSIQGSTVTLTQIIKWYKSDFGSSNEEAAKTIGQYLTGEKKEKFAELVKAGFKVKFGPYDWGTDSRKSVPYKKAGKCVIS